MNRTVALLFTLASFGVAAQSQVGTVLNDWGNISGGLYMNQRCKFLNEADSAAFQANVDAIQPVLGSDIGNPQILVMVQQGAKKTADSDKYKDCGENAKNIVNATSRFAASWRAGMEQWQKEHAEKKPVEATPADAK